MLVPIQYDAMAVFQCSGQQISLNPFFLLNKKLNIFYKSPYFPFMGCYLFRDRQSGGITYFSCFVVSWGGRHHGSIAMHVFTGCCLFRGSASRRHHLSCCHGVGISAASIICVMAATPVMSSLTAPCAASPVMMCQRSSSLIFSPSVLFFCLQNNLQNNMQKSYL